jgi:hypothetical protein
MAATPNGAAAPPPGQRLTAEELRAEIAQTRVELGETVQALAAKADVKARLQETADEAKAKARERIALARIEARSAVTDAPQRAQVLAKRLRESIRDNPKPYAIAAGLTVLLVVRSLWLRSRR